MSCEMMQQFHVTGFDFRYELSSPIPEFCSTMTMYVSISPVCCATDYNCKVPRNYPRDNHSHTLCLHSIFASRSSIALCTSPRRAIAQITSQRGKGVPVSTLQDVQKGCWATEERKTGRGGGGGGKGGAVFEGQENVPPSLFF